jgi:hypothetical protein
VSKPKHTPEPWARWGSDQVASTVTGKIVAEVPAYTLSGKVKNEDQANAERIVACVNACAGIEDPSAVQEMRKALSEVFSMIEDVRTGKVERGVNLYLADAQAVILEAVSRAEGRS